MRCLLLALENAAASPLEKSVEASLVLTVARAMRDGGRMAPFVVCSRDSLLAALLREQNMPHLAVGTGFSAESLAALRLRWHCRHWRGVLVQTFGQASVTLGNTVRRLRPQGSTLLAHAFLLSPPSRNLLQGSWQRSLVAADCIFCGSSHVRERLAEYQADAPTPQGPGERRLCLLPPFVDEDSAGFLSSVPLSAGQGERFIFCMRESLLSRSGAVLVTRAMSALWQREDLPPWEVRLYGGGDRFTEVFDEARSLGVTSRLSLLGEQNRDIMRTALQQADAFLVPGNSGEEAPVTLWAGLAAGLPAIVSRSPLHEERLQDDRSAVLFFEEGNPQALAEAMISLMHDAALRQELAARGRDLVRRLLPDGAARKLCTFFENWYTRRGWVIQAEAPSPSPDTEAPSSPVEDDKPAKSSGSRKKSGRK